MLDFFDSHLVAMLNGLTRGFLLFTLAAGLSLVFGLMRVLNLAHGVLLLLGGYVAVTLANDGRAFVLALVVAVAVGAALGVGLFAAVRPVESRGPLDQGLLTLGFTFILADLMTAAFGSDYQSPAPPPSLAASVDILGDEYPLYRLVVIGFGAAIAVGMYVVFERTRLGAIVKAAVSDPEMVSALGLRVSAIQASVFAVAAALAAFGGVIGGPILGVYPGLDLEVLVLALVVVVVGGLGSLRGALLGALLIGQAQSLGVELFPRVAGFLLFGVMALVLLFKPNGLFAEATR